jgi:hypothetical protein
VVAGPQGASTGVNHGVWCTVRPRRPTLPRFHIVSMACGSLVPQSSFRDPKRSGRIKPRSPPQWGRSSPTLFDLGLSGPEGDAATARVFAESLLTAVCLHLQSRKGPDPTLADLVDWLDAGGYGEVFAKLRGEPLSLTEYAVSELGSLAAEQQSLAVEMAVCAAKLAQALARENTA